MIKDSKEHLDLTNETYIQHFKFATCYKYWNIHDIWRRTGINTCYIFWYINKSCKHQN